MKPLISKFTLIQSLFTNSTTQMRSKCLYTFWLFVLVQLNVNAQINYAQSFQIPGKQNRFQRVSLVNNRVWALGISNKDSSDGISYWGSTFWAQLNASETDVTKIDTFNYLPYAQVRNQIERAFMPNDSLTVIEYQSIVTSVNRNNDSLYYIRLTRNNHSLVSNFDTILGVEMFSDRNYYRDAKFKTLEYGNYTLVYGHYSFGGRPIPFVTKYNNLYKSIEGQFIMPDTATAAYVGKMFYDSLQKEYTLFVADEFPFKSFTNMVVLDSNLQISKQVDIAQKPNGWFNRPFYIYDALKIDSFYYIFSLWDSGWVNDNNISERATFYIMRKYDLKGKLLKSVRLNSGLIRIDFGGSYDEAQNNKTNMLSIGDGYFFVVNNDGTGQSAFVITLMDTSLKIIWQKKARRGPDYFPVFSDIVYKNNELIIVGRALGGESTDYALIPALYKINKEGIFTSLPEALNQQDNKYVYPNPSHNKFFIPNDVELVSLRNNLGKEVNSKQLTTNPNEIETVNLPGGVYYALLKSNGIFYTQRLVLIK